MADTVVTNTSAELTGQKLAKVPSTSAYTSAPSSPTSGDLWLPSDGISALRYSGSAWAPWGPIFPLTAPVSGDFAWVNQGGASVDTTYGGIYLLAPATAGTSWRIRKKTAPSTPYTITAAFLASAAALDNAYQCIGFRESSSGKLVTFGLQASTGSHLKVDKYTDETTFSATYLDAIARFGGGSAIWLRIADNGTNRICSVSPDGRHWTVVHTVGRTDFLTANEVFFACQAQNASYDADMTLISWAQA